jgi:hypothetical protein
MAGRKTESVELKKLDIRKITLKIVGDSPLIMHRWDEKAKKMMLDKQMKKAVIKEAKDPEAQFKSSLYILDEKKGTYGFPADAFKESAVRGGKAIGVVMTDARGAFFVHGIYSQRDGRELVPITGKCIMREDMVKLETGVADIRYRGQIEGWSAEVVISYNASVISSEQIVNMFESAGFGVGIGEWRPTNKGMFGRFHVAA